MSRKILRRPAVEAKVGLKHTAIYELIKQRDFPEPIKLTKTSSGWFEDEIDAWLDKRAAMREAA